MHRSHRFLLAAAGATAVIGSTSGCAMACTQAGYTNVLEVVLTGTQRSEVASMQLCTDVGCVDGMRGASRDGWVFEFFIEAPREPKLTASDASGAKLTSTRLVVDWQPTTDPNGAGCENRSTASPVTLEVP